MARVGESYLTQEDLSEQLSKLPFQGDSLEARQQIIEQWVSGELLFREARRRGLRNDREVQRLLEENERSVMISALVARMYEETEEDYEPAELASYYERNKERLRLREPFVQVRYMATRSAEAAQEARTTLQEMARGDEGVEGWNRLVDQHAVDAGMSRALSSTFTAESRLFSSAPVLRARLANMREGEVAEVTADSLHHVMQLVERAPSGAVPEIAWVEEELARRLLIQTRKQLYARQVQRLRNEALAREDLEIR